MWVLTVIAETVLLTPVQSRVPNDPTVRSIFAQNWLGSGTAGALLSHVMLNKIVFRDNVADTTRLSDLMRCS